MQYSTINRSTRMMVSALALCVLLASCGGAEKGSEQDLSDQVTALGLPASMVQVGETYMAECPANCPSYVRWYSASAPIHTLRPQIMSTMEAAGVSVNQASASPSLFAARGQEHIFFVVLDPQMISKNTNAPPGATAEISVQLLPDA